MDNIPGLNPSQLKKVQKILSAHCKDHRNPVFVFGSRVEGQFRPSSDLDLYFTNTQELLPRFWVFLEEAFENSDLPFKVDLIDECNLSPQIKANVTTLKKIQIFPFKSA